MLTQEKSLPQAPQVWDKPTTSAQIGDVIRVPFAPVMQVVEKGTQSDGRVWLLVKRCSSTESEEWVLEPESPQQAQQPAHVPEQETAGFAGDSVSYELQPTQSAETEFERGRHHGEQDAQAGLHPMYLAPSDGYRIGYLEGYNSVLNPTTQQPEASLQLEWSVTRNGKCHWYDVWVGCKWVGRAETDEEAEREAQAYVATDEIRKRQNAAVMRAYA